MSSIYDILNEENYNHNENYGNNPDNEYSYNQVLEEISTMSLERISIEELQNKIWNPELSSSQRKTIFEQYYHLDSPTVLEVLHNLLGSYLENENMYVFEILFPCLNYDFIPFTHKIKLIQSLPFITIEEKLTFLSKHPLWTDSSDLSDLPMIFQLILTINTQETITYLKQIFEFPSLLENIKLKYINTPEFQSHIGYKHCLEVLFYQIKQVKNIILLSQHINNLDLLTETHLVYLQSFIMDDYTASLICDFFLSLTNKQFESFVEYGKKRLTLIKGYSSNIYDSSQNIHQVSADLELFIEQLMGYDTIGIQPIIEECNCSNLNEEQKQKIKLSIERIQIDSGIYTSKGLTLCTILQKVWHCINIKNDEELKTRFWEEILDMYDTCTTGHLLRLVNIFTGYENGIQLDVYIELKSVIFYRLGKLIETIEETHRDEIMEELLQQDQLKQNMSFLDETSNNTIQDKTSSILVHLYKKMAELKNELWVDYKTIIDDQKFEEYYRNALVEFTNGK